MQTDHVTQGSVRVPPDTGLQWLLTNRHAKKKRCSKHACQHDVEQEQKDRDSPVNLLLISVASSEWKQKTSPGKPHDQEDNGVGGTFDSSELTG